MKIREATAGDVPAMHAIRLRVRENRLSDPSVVQEHHYHQFMARDTKSWVCQVDGALAGFVMADVEQHNLWALFIAPERERRGIGRALHEVMSVWYFTRADRLRLTTSPRTRAERFYRRAGYTAVGEASNGELIFELRRADGSSPA